MSSGARAYVYDFANNEVPGADRADRGYWRDVGTLDAYYDAHMDLIVAEPVFNLYNAEWPILTWPDPLPPAKFVLDEQGRTGRAGLDDLRRRDRLGRPVRRSILSPGVRVHSCAEVEGSVLMHGVVSAAARSCARHPRQERAGRRGRPHRRRPRGGPRPLRGLPGGVVVIGKGAKVESG